MNRLRLWCTLFLVWMFVLYNIERLHEPINLASFIYVLAAALAIPMLLLPPLQRVPLPWTVLGTTPLVLAAKYWLRYPIGGAHLPLTVTELAAIWTTLALARQTGKCLDELRQAAVSTLLSHLRDHTQPFDQGQADIYRDLRRARQFERPLAVLAISPSSHSVDVSLDRFTLELQQEYARKYISARVAELLSHELKDCSILSHDDAHFVTVWPEADREAALAKAESLRQLAEEQLGIQLSVGVSVFPDEEVTLVKLLERAEADLQASRGRLASPPHSSTGAARRDEEVKFPGLYTDVEAV